MSKKINPNKIGQICTECATKAGWVPVNYAVGIWPGECDVCKKDITLENGGLTAPRDYVIKSDKKKTSKSDYAEWYKIIRGKSKLL